MANIFEQHEEKSMQLNSATDKQKTAQKRVDDFKQGLENVVFTDQLDIYLEAQEDENKCAQETATLQNELNDLTKKLEQFFEDHPKVNDIRIPQAQHQATISIRYDRDTKQISRTSIL